MNTHVRIREADRRVLARVLRWLLNGEMAPSRRIDGAVRIIKEAKRTGHYV